MGEGRVLYVNRTGIVLCMIRKGIVFAHFHIENLEISCIEI